MNRTDIVSRPQNHRGSRTGRLGLLLGFATVMLLAFESRAQTLDEALAIAYADNPQLRAARTRLRVVDEGVAGAKAGWRPTITTQVSVATSFVHRDPERGAATSDTFVPGSLSASVAQPLYRGGRTEAAVRRTVYDVQAERARMYSIEQDVLLQATTAYVDTIRDNSVLDLQINNLKRLQKQLQATRERFAVGEVTRTDVAQAESRVARAEADRTLAAGNLVSSRVRFERIVGVMPGTLIQPSRRDDLPANREEAVATALENSFTLINAKFEELSERERIAEISGELLPTVSVVGQAIQSYDTNGAEHETSSISVEARIRFPIYQAGVVSARVRSAKEAANVKRIMVEASRRQVIDASARAFEAWKTAVARTTSLAAEVSSAQIALEGVEQEAAVGARTVLDVLDAEQELLDAQVGLVRAERNAFVTSYELLASLGWLTAEALGLPVDIYDPDRHFLQVQDKYIGTAIPGQ